MTYIIYNAPVPTWEEMAMPSPDWRKTACNLCYVNCGLEVLVESERITKVRGDRDNPTGPGGKMSEYRKRKVAAGGRNRQFLANHPQRRPPYLGG